ncbi:hypothetical protein ASPVEDRAFT_36681 [Aspergillus versicolor CBS 583.65]|uniref:Uncharacterized protein n=1 Tax=Aspergillus versicolor CBS 583.65 TaxID=1036611 RepID=A0A1L9P6Z2_ASPVE|nr:uncharacterized protein ASPVEDRAFT_36681 [Aspergillus versicolor CBS 583.65]OJI97268.1 hypothetical protein ASPVEDRAFT_36681 [Aspergillus versicolor CBS 583.65]
MSIRLGAGLATLGLGSGLIGGQRCLTLPGIVRAPARLPSSIFRRAHLAGKRKHGSNSRLWMKLSGQSFEPRDAAVLFQIISLSFVAGDS